MAFSFIQKMLVTTIPKQGPEHSLRNVQCSLDGHSLGFSPGTLFIANLYSILNSFTGKYCSIAFI